MKRPRRITTGLCAALVAAIAAGTFIRQTTFDTPAENRTEINVLAAASLNAVFTQLTEQFESLNPGIDIRLSFAGSSTLATQIMAGAPMNLVAMADLINMEKIAEANAISTSSVTTFATNRLAIVTAKNNPLNITSLRDLERSDIMVVLCEPNQPCGHYADDIISRARLSVTAASRESSVSGVLSRVRTGEADAGIAYVSDAVSNTDITAVSLPTAENIVAEYPLALAAQQSTRERDAAQLFMNFILSPAGQDTLMSYGFLTPS